MKNLLTIRNEPVFMAGLRATGISLTSEEGMFLINKILDKAQELANGGDVTKEFYVYLMKDFKLDQISNFDHIDFINTVNGMLLHFSDVLTVKNLLSFNLEVNYVSDSTIGLNKHKKVNNGRER